MYNYFAIALLGIQNYKLNYNFKLRFYYFIEFSNIRILKNYQQFNPFIIYFSFCKSFIRSDCQ